jgi:hypothetical protein
LDDGQSEAGAVGFAGVIGSEHAFTFFGGESNAGVGNFHDYPMASLSRAQSERAALWHSIQSVQH